LRWTRNPQEQEKAGCPAPGVLDEIDVEGIGFIRKIVRIAEWVWKIADERVGCIEICPIENGVGGAKGNDGGEDGKNKHDHT